MIETVGLDIFDQIEKADAICITTNCSIYGKVNPMGALAGAAAKRWKEIPKIYASLLKTAGSVPIILGYINKNNHSEFYSINSINFNDYSIYEDDYTALVAFPTMYEIGEPADINLIKRGAFLLFELANLHKWSKVYIGAPGIGVGGLSYADQVKPTLEPIFDDRFIVMQK